MVDELIAFLALAHSKSFVSSHKFQGIKESAQLVISELFITLVIEWRQSCMSKRYSAPERFVNKVCLANPSSAIYGNKFSLATIV